MGREIIDNSEGNQLADFLKEKFDDSDEVDIATAFLNVKAFSMVQDEVEDSERFRLLLGKSPEFESDRTLGEEIESRIENEVEGMEFSRRNKGSVEDFIDFLEMENVEVRLYDENFLHGKAYRWDDGVVIGSSNFTAGGLRGNNELNSVGRESKARYARDEWFDEFWEDARPFNKELIELLKQSRFGDKEYSPYKIFLKTLYEYQKDDLGNDSEAGESGRVDLTEFQEDAVRRVETRMEKYGGCLVADSVGLGKTYIAKRMIEKFRLTRNKNFLVVAPASLEKMWRVEMKDVGVSENIISQEKLARDKSSSGPVKKANRAVGGDLDEVELIVVDESHNFRNPKSNRYENLFRLIEKVDSEGKKPYVLFLTATPINNSIWDLYYQLKLMVEGNDSAFVRDGIGSLYREFRQAEDEGDPSLLTDLLNEISVRRTREYIEENYPNAYYEDEDGNKVDLSFPDRELDDLEYELDSSYQDNFETISKKIKEKLTMAYYRKLDYRKSGELSNEEELERGRMKGLEDIFEKLLLKRLESSVGAFKESVSNHIRFLDMLLDKIEQEDKILTRDTFADHIMDSEGELDSEEYEDELVDFERSEYEDEKFISDIRNDRDVFEEILSMIDDIDYEEDQKIQKLVSELDRMTENEQVVVFAFYSDTVEYVYDYLADCEELSDQRIEMITGDSSGERRTQIVEDYREGSVDVLLSTDVLSEGQNLQTAKHLINYDLHWNPTRMVQRAGRIDRIGTPHDTVVIHNFFPSDKLEELLELVSTLEDKISDIDEAIGMDQRVMNDEINPKVFGATTSLDSETLERIRENDESLLDELKEDGLGSGEDFWQPIKTYMRDHTVKELENIPLGVYSGHEGSYKGIFFYYRYAEEFHYWYFYDMQTGEILTDKAEILNIISVNSDEGREIPEFFDEVFQASAEVREELENHYKSIEQQSKDDKRAEWDRDQAKKFLIRLTDSLREEAREHVKRYPEDENKYQSAKRVCSELRQINLTKQRTSTLRKYWRSFKGRQGHGDWEKLLSQVEEFLEDKEKSSSESLEEFDSDKLELVTAEFVS